MDVSFELYKVFYYVAKALSFSEASEKLFISQSAVSQSIKQLEKQLNCILFFRNTKRVTLTHEGEVLFNHIEQAFHFIKAGERTLNDMNSLEQGEVKIAASDTICKYFLMPYFKNFIKVYPNIKLHITNRTSPKCIELLKKGKVDFCVVNLPENLDNSIFSIKITKPVKDVFVAGKQFIELSGRKVDLVELEKYPLLVLEKATVTRDYFDKLLKESNLDLKPEVELGSVELLVEMTKIGLGISFVPNECVNSKEELFILDIAQKIESRHLGVVTLNSLPLPAAAAKFIDMME